MARRGRSDRDRHGSLADQIGLRLVKRRAELTTQRDVECERLGDVLKPGSPTICDCLSPVRALQALRSSSSVIYRRRVTSAGALRAALGC